MTFPLRPTHSHAQLKSQLCTSTCPLAKGTSLQFSPLPTAPDSVRNREKYIHLVYIQSQTEPTWISENNWQSGTLSFRSLVLTERVQGPGTTHYTNSGPEPRRLPCLEQVSERSEKQIQLPTRYAPERLKHSREHSC